MRLSFKLTFLGLALLCLSGCVQKESHPPLFRVLHSAETGINFQNQLPVNLDLNIFNYMYYYNGGGLASGDFNNDGLIDLYFTGNLDEEKMYLNRGEMQFEDVSLKTEIDGGANSWSTGASVADINGDGLLDIYLSQVSTYRDLTGANRLFICQGIDQDGIPQYEDKAKEYGLDFSGFSTQAGFFDYDLDGDLDMYLMNHSLHHNGTFGQRKNFLDQVDEESGDKLFRNDGGLFTDVTVEAGIMSHVAGYGLGLAFGDLNQDGWPDIYVGNDFHENDYLYVNQGDGTFEESITKHMMHTSRFSMGVDIADINNDHLPDVISLDMLPEDPEILKRSEGEDARDIFQFKLGYGYNHQYARNALQLNTARGSFQEIARFSGVFATDWSWSPLLFDMDMDGHKDLFISNGIPKRMNDIDYINFMSGNDLQYKIQFDQLTEQDLEAINRIPEIKLENKFYLGKKSLQYKDIGAFVDGEKPGYSNAAIYADLDNDGDLDIVTNNINAPATVYQNVCSDAGKQSLKVTLEGSELNKQGIGAKVAVWQNGNLQYAAQQQVRAFQASMLGPLWFADPKGEGFDSVVVSWPDGLSQTILDVKDKALTLKYSDAEKGNSWKQPAPAYILVDRTEEYGIDFTHKENDFVEFNREFLIPHAVSSEGPALVSGDLNGDGLEDFFVGSSKREKNGLYFQLADGKFERQAFTVIDSTYEEVDAVLADLDGDGDLDMAVATGGNEWRLNHRYSKQLLLFNDGKGNLSLSDAFELNLTASCVAMWDANEDGNPDLFFGARATPWSYGEKPKSYIMLGDGQGNFSEAEVPDLEAAFIKNCTVADIDGDGTSELVTVEEWGGISAWYSSPDKISAVSLTQKEGWWNFVEALDLNADGAQDLLVGNQGLNNRFQISEKEPLRLYYEDFDENGTAEQVLTYYVEHREVPFHNKKELEKQMPAVKKQYVMAADFAKAPFKEMFAAADKASALEFTEPANGMLLSEGDKFNFEALSADLQYSPFNAAVQVNDALMLLFGNFYDPNIQMGRYDADFGTLVNVSGQSPVQYPLGGEAVKGQVSNAVPIEVAGKKMILVGVNDAALQLLELKF